MDRSTPFFTQGPLHISYLPGQSDTLVLSFSGVGEMEDAVPRDEAARMAGGEGENHVVFIADGSRSWMNGPGIMDGVKTAYGQLVEKIRPTRVVAMGNSMGGTAALIFASEIAVNAVLSLVPQFSVCPDLVPWEQRWTHYTDKITNWPHPHCPDLSGKDMQVMILHGSDRLELRHAKMFRQRPNVDHYLVARSTHGMSLKLKRQGRLQPIISAFIADDIPAARAAVTAAGGMTFTQYRSTRRAAKAAKLNEAKI